MARPRQPVDLIVHKGKSHLGKDEIEQRRKQELNVDLVDVKPPKHLTKKLKDEFTELAEKLLSIKIFTELDEESLARYLIAKEHYLKYNKLLNKAMRESDIDQMEQISRMQDKAFKQCRLSASDLGLTISSRARLIVPESNEPPKENKFNKFAK